jgi:hypothetical protein
MEESQAKMIEARIVSEIERLKRQHAFEMKTM